MLGQYSLGGPANKRALLASEGLDPDGMEGARPGRRPLRRLGHDPDLLPADLPQREADHRPPIGSCSARPRPGSRPAIAPASRAGRPPSPPELREPSSRASRRRRRALYAPHLDQPAQPSTVTGADGRVSATARPVAIWLGLLVLYFVWGSTYIGIRLADESIPPFLMAGVRFLLAGLRPAGLGVRGDPADPRGTRRPTRPVRRPGLPDPAPAARLGDRRRRAPARRDGPRRPRRADRPGRRRRLPDRPAAGLDRRPRPDLLRRAAAPDGRRGDRRRAWSGWRSSSVRSGTGGGPAFDPFGLVVLLCSPICWASGSLYSSHKAVLPRRPLTATGLQMVCGGVLLLIAAVADRRAGELRRRRRSRAARSLGLAYLTSIGSLVGFTTYVWLLRVAPLPEGRDLRLRQPDRGLRAGRPAPGRDDRRPDGAGRRRDRRRRGPDRDRPRPARPERRPARRQSGHRPRSPKPGRDRLGRRPEIRAGPRPRPSGQPVGRGPSR